ncbi:MAG: hypothetical protein PF508_07145, partial [Spirochaeta sp.]|nr:hypothetical protein [Spirochaeta sp.]
CSIDLVDRRAAAFDVAVVDQHDQGAARELHFVSPAARRRWAQVIREHARGDQIDPGVIEWGLLGDSGVYRDAVVSTGAARNTLLLAGIGRPVLSIDDDILPEYAVFGDCDADGNSDRPEEGAPRVGDAVPPYARLYRSVEELQKDARPASDPLNALLSVLGTVPDRDTDLSGLTPGVAGDWEQHPLTVIAGRLGVFGSRVLGEPFEVIRRPQEFAWADIDDRSAVGAIQEHGVRARHTTATTFGRQGFSTACCAFDGSTVLPPFFPWGRGQDDTFSVLAVWTHQNALFADLPVAVFHDPSGKRPFSEMEIGRYSVHSGLYNYLTLRSLCAGIATTDPGQRITALVRRYREIGRIAPGDFRDFLRSIQMAYLQEVREEIESQIATHRAERDRLEPYARELLLRRYQDSVIRELARPDSLVPTELRGAPGTIEEKLAFLQERYRLWGELLEAWPAIRNAAAAIGLERLLAIAAEDDAAEDG